MHIVKDMFLPTISLWEVVARATVMYLILFGAIRFMLKREGGAVNIADLLVVVAIVDGAQPAFNGDAKSVTESVVFVATVIFWSYGLNWISFHVPALTFLTAARPLLLVKDGQMCRGNMRQALMTREELMQQLREEGIEELARVRHAYLEGNGEISVIPFEDEPRAEGADNGSVAPAKAASAS